MRVCKPVCTNDEAREHFKECGLTYRDITEGDILSLVMLLNREFKKSNKAGETSTTITLSKKMLMKRRLDGSIVNCFLFVNGGYFTQRECISFNANGFIGFAGWADEENTNPIRRAFLTWCDELKEAKANA